jgi:crotonobetainyl-CoA:carnitine CoA-transferase CaiB-like acyl-CoA transferase
MAQGAGGIMSMTGEAEGPPLRRRPQLPAVRPGAAPLGRGASDRVFEGSQVQHREMKISMTHPAGSARLIGSPLKLSDAPVSFRRPPPALGQHADEVLNGVLKLDAGELEVRREKGII